MPSAFEVRVSDFPQPSCSVRVRGLEQIRLLGRHAAERVSGAGAGDGALVAMDAAVMADLEEERAVAETVAALDALRAADAELLVNCVFVIRVFDKSAFDGGGGTKLILGGSGQRVRLGFKVAGAEIAVAAHRKGVNALHGGLFQDALGGAIAAAHTFLRVNLPDPAFSLAVVRQHTAERAETGNAQQSRTVAQEGPPRCRFVDGL